MVITDDYTEYRRYHDVGCDICDRIIYLIDDIQICTVQAALLKNLPTAQVAVMWATAVTGQTSQWAFATDRLVITASTPLF